MDARFLRAFTGLSMEVKFCRQVITMLSYRAGRHDHRGYFHHLQATKTEAMLVFTVAELISSGGPQSFSWIGRAAHSPRAHVDGPNRGVEDHMSVLSDGLNRSTVKRIR